MSEIKTLSIDLETFSSADLPKCGVYKYVESPDFEILLFGYSVNEEPVQVIDVACGEEIPESILKMLTERSSGCSSRYNPVLQLCLFDRFRNPCPSYR